MAYLIHSIVGHKEIFLKPQPNAVHYIRFLFRACVCVSVFLLINKAVEGSGSKGTPKLRGEGCDMQGIFDI